MKYYIIAGERSGDLHGANLIKALKGRDADAEIRFWGGDYMKAAGGELVVHYNEIAVMGFWEVLKNYAKLRKFINFCKKDVVSYQPDVLILIDFAGFNMRIAKHAKQKGIKTFYYISPKVWAWNQKRALKIKATIDRMFVILPFEKAFYKKFDYEVDYVGNPLLDAIRDFKPNTDFIKNNKLGVKPIIAVLPGSRKQEIDNILDIMLTISSQFTDYQFVVAGIKNIPTELYAAAGSVKNVKIIFDQTYDILKNAHAAIVTSGTATLETALFEVPQIVCYKTSSLTYQISKRLIMVDYISLVNLIAGKAVVKELIQDDLNAKNLREELDFIIGDGAKREEQLKGYQEIKVTLGDEKASENLSKLIVGYLS